MSESQASHTGSESIDYSESVDRSDSVEVFEDAASTIAVDEKRQAADGDTTDGQAASGTTERRRRLSGWMPRSKDVQETTTKSGYGWTIRKCSICGAKCKFQDQTTTHACTLHRSFQC